MSEPQSQDDRAYDQFVREQNKQSQDRVHGEKGPLCDYCGGRMTWCATCVVWSRTCCVEYGTCQCN